MRITKAAAVLFLLFIIESTTQAEIPAIKVTMSVDGKFDEWKRLKPLADDSIKDIPDTERVNFSKVWAEVAGKNLYISYCCTKPINFENEAYRYNVFVDADNDLSTGYRGWDGNWALGADYLVQGATVFEFSGSPNRVWEWKKKGAAVYKIEGSQIEMKVPLSSLGLNNKQDFRVLFYGDNVSVTDYVPDDNINKSFVIKGE